MDRPRVLAPAADQPFERGPGLLRAARPHEPGTKERVVSAAKLVILPAVRAKRRRLDAKGDRDYRKRR